MSRQTSTTHQPAPRRVAKREPMPALVREALSSRTPSPEALAARDEWLKAQRAKVGPW